MDKTTDYKTKVAYATSVNLQPNQAFTPCVNVERLAWSACSLSSCARLQPHLSAPATYPCSSLTCVVHPHVQ